MRDIYNRKVKLECWIQRIHTELQDNEADKQDILKFVTYLQEKDKSILWIIRCITALLQLKKEIKKTLENQTVLDPMMGSGTTGIAALDLGRKFIRIEK